MSRVCSFCGASIDSSVQKCPNCGAPNDGYVAPSSSPIGKNLNAPLPIEGQIRGFGDRLVQSWGLSKPGAPAGFLELLVRAAFLDGAAYRQAAADKTGNGAALLALFLPVLAGWLGAALMDLGSIDLMGLGTLAMLFGLAARLIVYVLAIGIMALLSFAVLQTKLSFGELFRALAYAQSPGILTVIPVLGSLLGLWRLCTTVVAIREISGADLIRSAILLAIGVVGMIALNVLLAVQLFHMIFRSFL